MENIFCPIRDIVDRFGDKWSILMLWTLNEKGVMRFGELGRSIPDISQKMQTVTLRALEEDGLVKRKTYPEIPPRVEYSLTETGQSLIPHIQDLIDWALQHREVILTSREKFEKKK
ncbi:MAG: helix-turn-helix transcriptional regulator [Dysgonamonadaceae bacterium]|jgi:DNA-binding HxlR family transcriptional regulator|nr:helix-turn-helix transcriptional regulator [Dysgonamonadaceae bacterium]